MIQVSKKPHSRETRETKIEKSSGEDRFERTELGYAPLTESYTPLEEKGYTGGNDSSTNIDWDEIELPSGTAIKTPRKSEGTKAEN